MRCVLKPAALLFAGLVVLSSTNAQQVPASLRLFVTGDVPSASLSAEPATVRECQDLGVDLIAGFTDRQNPLLGALAATAFDGESPETETDPRISQDVTRRLGLASCPAPTGRSSVGLNPSGSAPPAGRLGTGLEPRLLGLCAAGCVYVGADEKLQIIDRETMAINRSIPVPISAAD
jgi:hypothetical protein